MPQFIYQPEWPLNSFQTVSVVVDHQHFNHQMCLRSLVLDLPSMPVTLCEKVFSSSHTNLECDQGPECSMVSCHFQISSEIALGTAPLKAVWEDCMSAWALGPFMCSNTSSAVSNGFIHVVSNQTIPMDQAPVSSDAAPAVVFVLLGSVILLFLIGLIVYNHQKRKIKNQTHEALIFSSSDGLL
jgi:hypothetical protein